MVRSRMAIRRKLRSRSRLSWAGLTVVPWCVAAGLLVSATADAGQDAVIGATRVDLTDLAPTMPDDLVPSRSDVIESTGFTLPRADLLARYVHGGAHETRAVAAEAGEIEPKTAAKGDRRSLPVVDRSHRLDPAVAMRPTFDTRLRAAGTLLAYRAADLAFRANDPAERASDFTPGPVDAPWPDAAKLQPLLPDTSITTRHSHAASSPRASASATTPHGQDGSTPVVARAESLASSTPAAADGAPIEIAALPKFSRGPHGLVLKNQTVVGIAQYHPDYATMIETAKSASEQRCLAQAVYFEARSEPEEGQAAVAQVVLNRAMSGLYPGSVCGVVFQNQQHHNACQFSFACEGHALRVSEGESWTNAVRIAREVTDGATYVSDIGGSTHYHANYVRPFWARSLKKMDVIGHHIFYTLRPGQT